MAHDPASSTATCRCGRTTIALTGAPIQSATCYCESCRTAGHMFERDLHAGPVVRADGGVDYCLYRKDRVRIAEGAENLREYRLKPDSPTRRVAAGCCGSPLFLDFTPGHWLTVYRDRLSGHPSEPQLRMMTKDRPEGVTLPDDLPTYAAMPPGVMLKLLAAWAAMGFRRPKIDW